MKKEIVKKVISKIKKESFNKENPTELLSQLIKVIQRDYQDPEVDKVVKELKQRGKSDLKRDKAREALSPGKRISKSGKVYWETRKNRSDKTGSRV